jgi:hypothetical protein
VAPTESDLIKSLKTALADLGEPVNDCNLPRLVTIKGYLAETHIGGVDGWRIYLDHSMTRYYEFAHGDVIYATATGGTEDEPDRIWVRQGAATRLVNMRPTRAEAKPGLLSGPIVQQYVQAQPPPVAYGQPPQYIQAPPPGTWWPGYEDDDGSGTGWEPSGCNRPCFSPSP